MFAILLLRSLKHCPTDASHHYLPLLESCCLCRHDLAQATERDGRVPLLFAYECRVLVGIRSFLVTVGLGVPVSI